MTNRIAFIGLGNMGAPMARNLIAKGFAVTAFDRAETAKRNVADAAPASSLAEACADADTVITMLPAGGQVREVYLSTDGIIAAADPGTLLIDCSTIDVATARDVASAAADSDLAMIDAPVSGGVAAATAGALTFMVGGAESEVARATPILSAMGKAVIRAGDSGAGQAAKICNNMLLAISMIGTCEAFLLADKLGLDRQKLFDIASEASGQCWALTSYCPVPGPVPASPANRHYAPGFTAAMMLKDLTLAADAAAAGGAATPLGAHARDLYRRFAAAGHEGMDFSGIITWLAEDADEPTPDGLKRS